MYLLCIMYVYMFMVLNLFIARVLTITFATLSLCLSFLPCICWPPITQLKSQKYLQAEEPRYQTDPSLVNKDIFQSQSSLIARIVLQQHGGELTGAGGTLDGVRSPHSAFSKVAGKSFPVFNRFGPNLEHLLGVQEEDRPPTLKKIWQL